VAIKKIAIHNFDFAEKNIVAASSLNQPVLRLSVVTADLWN
jgi:hypothetical protein